MAESESSLQDTLEFAISLAREGGDFTLPFFYASDLKVDRKADNSHVTEADRGAEELMRERLTERFPDDGIVGEEWGVKEGTSGRTWFLDPVDGTEAFVRKVPLYGTLVAAAQDGSSVADVGVIYLPAISQIVYASKSNGSWTANKVPAFGEGPVIPPDVRRASVSDVSVPDDACLLTTHEEWWAREDKETVLKSLLGAFGIRRMWGHCYAPALVATGMADVWVEPSAHDWDFAAATLIIEEAGGRATTISGERTFRGKNLVISNGKLHDRALASLEEF